MSTREDNKNAQAPQRPPPPTFPPAELRPELLDHWRAEANDLRLRLARAEQALADAQRRAGEAESMKAALAERAAELTKRARELARSNAELDLFASVVAHDLRAPLTSIGGCAELLAEMLAGRLDEEAAGILQDLKDSVHHMGRLLQSLLMYSRVGKGGLKLTHCDANQVLATVLVDLRAAATAAQATITYDTLPVVEADEGLLAQLFQNLLENAVKYHGSAAPIVHVSAQADPAGWVFSVADNGIGIEPRHFERIFQIFQRLHADESRYPGVGVGLATCKKIVERHGGHIWVESVLGAGSTFHFTLPRR